MIKIELGHIATVCAQAYEIKMADMYNIGKRGRNAMARRSAYEIAHQLGALQTDIAAHFDCHFTTVSQCIAKSRREIKPDGMRLKILEVLMKQSADYKKLNSFQVQDLPQG